MFHTIRYFVGLFRRFREQNVSDFCVKIDNLELPGLALQPGALRQAHWISKNSWRRSLGALKIDHMLQGSLVSRVAELRKFNLSQFLSMFPIYLWGTTDAIHY